MAAKKNKNSEAQTFDELAEQIGKEFGEGSLITGLNVGAVAKVDVFPTDIATIDLALGCGGIPQGRIIEIYGAESSGKTTLCLQIIAACQKHYFPKKERHGKVVFVDAEHAFDPDWASKIGVDLNKLAISQPDSGEQALSITEKLTKSGKVDLIIIDSVAALVPEAELDGEMGSNHIGAQARMLSQACRKLSGISSKAKTSIIFINQVREKIGVMFGNPETTPGGRALKFYSSVRGQLTKGSAIKSNEKTIGFKPTIKFVKNKVAAPFTKAQFDIYVGASEMPIYGIDSVSSLIEAGEDLGFITRNGSHYRYGDTVLGNGLVNASKSLRENSEVISAIREEIYSRFNASGIDDEISVDDEIIDGD